MHCTASAIGFPGRQLRKWISEEPNRQQWADSLKQIAATGYANTVPAAMIQAPEANDVIGAGVQSVMLGNASPKDAGCKMDSDLNKLMPK
jgi:ABC-type glycerol-3-phosphate transport system substrate-binding protein